MRADRTSACPYCRLRFERTAVCPRCGRKQLVDLRSADERRQLLKLLSSPPAAEQARARTPLEDLAYRDLRKTAWAVGIGGFFGALILRSNGLGPGIALLLGVLAVVVLLYLAVGLWRLWRYVYSPERSVPNRLRIRRVKEIAPAGESVSVTGTVAVLETLESPIWHDPCVAFRVVGQGRYSEVDDAFAVPFEIRTSGGKIRVEPEHAWIALPVEQEPEPMCPDAALAEFLEIRGVFPQCGAISLTEAVLRRGDPVVVEGYLGQSAGEPSGYRRRVEIRTIRGRPASPLLIRRPAEGGG